MAGLITDATTDASGYDFAGILELVGGDHDFLEEFVAVFDQDASRLVEEMRRAAGDFDLGALSRLVHSLKGLMSHFGDSPAMEHCRALESFGSGDDRGVVAGLAESLAGEVDRIRRALADLAA